MAAEHRRGFCATLPRFLGRRTLWTLTLAVAASLVLAGVELSVSVFLQLFLKRIGLLSADMKVPLENHMPSAGVLAGALAVIALVRGVAQFLVSHSGYVAMETVSARVRRLAVWDMLLHPSRRVVAASTVNARIGDLAMRSSLFCYYGSNLLSLGVQSAALIPIMFVTAPGETGVALAGLAVVGVIVLRLTRVIRGTTRTTPDQFNRLTEGIQRVARNALLVRILRTERHEHGRLTSAIDTYRDLLVRAGVLGNLANVMPPFAGILLILVIVGASQAVFHTAGITLLAFLYLFIRFVMTVSSTVTNATSGAAVWPAFQHSLEFAERFDGYQIDEAMLPTPGSNELSARVSSDELPVPEVVVTDVSFSYPDTSAKVLRDVSVQVERGKQFAIVGPSGSGKSTLLSIILGLLEPDHGQVQIDGRPPREYFSAPDTRVGYVGAEPFLIAGTIRDNLRYGLELTAADDDLQLALDRARLGPFVRTLPLGLDYRIAEDGAGLSAGQKQRLCLARALLNRPHVLVLDEATANLDVTTEAEVAEMLRELRGTCTTILVSHRAGILKYADRVVELHATSSSEPP